MGKPILKKIVLITGATSGIGKASAKIYAKNGYQLIITGRRKERLEELKEKLERKYGINIYTLCFDVRNRKVVKKKLESLPEKWKKINILLNNAGLAKGYASLDKGNIDDWETMINTNVLGLLYVTKAVSKMMIKNKDGHIINICSTAGHEVYPNGNVYCASKHAVDAITKSMRLDFYKYGLRISQVSPGHVEETEFAMVRFDGNKEKASIYKDFNPLTSKDVARTIYFISTQPSHVNIQDVLMMGTQQASSNFIDRSGRKNRD